MASANISVRNSLVKKENSGNYWNPFTNHTDIPLLVLHDLACHENRIVEGESEIDINEKALSHHKEVLPVKLQSYDDDLSFQDYADNFVETQYSDDNENYSTFTPEATKSHAFGQNNKQSEEKQDDLGSVRKSKRKSKKNAFYIDSFVTYTSDMFESYEESVSDSELYLNDCSLDTKKNRCTATVVNKSREKIENRKDVEVESISKKQIIESKRKGKAKGKVKTKINKSKPNDVEKIEKISYKSINYRENTAKQEIPSEILTHKSGEAVRKKIKSNSKSSSKAPQQRKLREKTFFCEYCPESFSTRWYLKLHIMHHTNERPYKCNICGKAFRMRWRLNMHRYIHQSIKPFSCKVCGWRTCRKDGLVSHFKRNHGVEDGDIISERESPCEKKVVVKPFSCDICGKHFLRRSDTIKHIKIKHRVSTTEEAAKHVNHLPTVDTTEPSSHANSSANEDSRKISGRHRPYSCTLCPRHFTNKEKGFSHLKLCHDLLPYEFESCLKTEQSLD